jgi:hypothetical protein
MWRGIGRRQSPNTRLVSQPADPHLQRLSLNGDTLHHVIRWNVIIRRAQVHARLVEAEAPWRQHPATEKQTALLRKLGLAVRAGLTKGEAADLLAAVLGDWGYPSATHRCSGGPTRVDTPASLCWHAPAALGDQRTRQRHVQGRCIAAPDVPRGGASSPCPQMTPRCGRPI